MEAALVARRLLPLLAVFAAMAALAACGNNERQDTTLDLLIDGEAIATQVPRQQAVDALSERVGFPVKLATKLPPGDFDLVAIEGRMANPVEAMGDDGRTNHVAAIYYVEGEPGATDSTALRIVEHSRQVEIPDGAEEIEAGGKTLYMLPIGPGGRSFTWNDGDRGYVVELGEPVGEEDITPEQVASLLGSLR